MTYQLAQINIGRILGLPDSEIMKPFMDALDEINALADASPGFVWRLQTDSGNAMDVRAFDDPYLAINISVWESVDALFDYTYKSMHTDYLKRRKEWFEPYGKHHACMWWVPSGHRPTTAEAIERLDHFNQHGATEYAFSFKNRFPAPQG